MAMLAELAPAKVNLTLHVAGRRADGFHELASLVAFAGSSASDTLSCEPAKPYAVSMTGPFAGSIAGRNLVETAIALACEQEPNIATGHFVLLKLLPVAAGIGGGSADAGAVLRLLQRLNPSTAIDWMAIAKRLGADVPVCFANRAAFMTGTGDRVTPCDALPPLHIVLINPRVPVPSDKTAQVFRRLSAPALPDGYAPTPPPGPFVSADRLIGYLAEHGNDLEAPAHTLVPDIAVVMAALRRSTSCRMARMSGGGPTCFGVYDTAHEAQSAALTISGAHPAWWVAATTLS